MSFYAAAGALLASAHANAATAPSQGSIFLPSVFQPSGTIALPTGVVQPVSVLSGSGQSSSASASDWLANARVTYNFDTTTALTAVAAHTVAPDFLATSLRPTRSASFCDAKSIIRQAYPFLGMPPDLPGSARSGSFIR